MWIGAEFYSCFISYSTKDQRFAERLFNDLQGNGVRCWFAPEHLKIGAKTRPAIDETIRLHDKVLLVLSKHSVASDWVEQEVETALARERRDKSPVLFPIRVDKSVTGDQSGWPALIWNTRNVGDFTRWKNDDAYRKAFDRLLRDLKPGRGRKPRGYGVYWVYREVSPPLPRCALRLHDAKDFAVSAGNRAFSAAGGAHLGGRM